MGESSILFGVSLSVTLSFLKGVFPITDTPTCHPLHFILAKAEHSKADSPSHNELVSEYCNCARTTTKKKYIVYFVYLYRNGWNNVRKKICK